MPLEWKFAGHRLVRQRLPLLMGILNVTPDSFSDGGQHPNVESAVAHGLQLAADGADIIDVGGESTRPGAAPVAVEEELRRTIPVIRELAQQTAVPISIDTTRSEVARQSLLAGAVIVNDISGLTFDDHMLDVCGDSDAGICLTFDDHMLDVCRDSDAGICLMHIRGTPQTMQQDPQYADVVAEVCAFLEQQLARCTAGGIAAERICLDPGIGFGKTAEHNLELLRAVETMRQRLQRPLLVGHSRKRFLSKLLSRSVDERLSGTIGVSIALAQRGVDMLRVHDVRAVRDALIAWSAVTPEQALPHRPF